MYRTTISVLTAVFLTAFVSQARPAGHTDASTVQVRQARETLKDMEQHAAAAATEAGEAEEASHNDRTSWQAHTDYLEQIKENLNQIGSEMKRLEAEQNSLALWEREALATVAPMLKDAAENTDRAINVLNDHRDHIWVSSEYSACTKKIMQDDKQAAKTLHDLAKLEKGKSIEKKAQERLENESGM